MEQSELRALSAEIGRRLVQRGWRLATAESCTGGLLGHLLTEIAGSSAYYQGGVIAYDNAVKAGVLGVEAQTLERYGAVSDACAHEMAQGVRRLLGTEIGVATTGIAGPGGGSAAKPVGLVYIAVATPDGMVAERHVFAADRSGNKIETARRALEIVYGALPT